MLQTLALKLSQPRMSAQERFNEQYITSQQVCERLGITRGALAQARDRGKLKDAVSISGHVVIWERKAIEPELQEWEKARRERIGV